LEFQISQFFDKISDPYTKTTQKFWKKDISHINIFFEELLEFSRNR